MAKQYVVESYRAGGQEIAKIDGNWYVVECCFVTEPCDHYRVKEFTKVAEPAEPLLVWSEVGVAVYCRTTYDRFGVEQGAIWTIYAKAYERHLNEPETEKGVYHIVW